MYRTGHKSRSLEARLTQKFKTDQRAKSVEGGVAVLLTVTSSVVA